MDEQLQHRWRIGKAPFDGQCIRLRVQVPLSTLRCLLRTIVDVLRERKKNCDLYRFDDWHEHDGYVTVAQAIDWDMLSQVLLSDQTLHHSRHGDAYVRWAYYPDDLTFLLRYQVLSPDEAPELPEPQGDCDLSADADVIGEICSKVEPVTELEAISAKAYFDQIYAG